MKKALLAVLLVMTLVVGLFAFQAFADEPDEIVFNPYTAEDGARQYCVCGNKFVADANGTIAYVNGEDGCKNHKDESGNIVAGCDGTLLFWMPWTHTDHLPKNTSESGNWYLTARVDMTGQNSIQDNVKVVLDLNGYEAWGKENTRVYSIHKAGASLILTDTSAAQSGKLVSWGTHKDHSLTMWVYLGSMDMYGGTIDASRMTTTGGTSSYAPCVRVSKDMTFNMFGGKIIGGNCPDSVGEGASVAVSSGGTMNLYGGEITDGNAYNGGNVLVSGTLNAYGGKITNGTASNNGGNIYLKGGQVNITAGVEISGGNAKSGGGIALANNKDATRELNISGGNIKNNNSSASGGAIYVHGYSGKISQVNISGGTFSENYAGSNGGAIGFGTSFSSANITGGTFIDNRAKGKGGHIYFIFGGTHSISGGSFTGGEAANGGSIGIDGNVDGTVSITGGSYENGYSSATGGNFYIYGNASITGATMIGGSGTGGGNIAVYGTVTLADVNVANGVARTGGGGNVFVNVSKDGDTITKAGDLTIASGTYSYGHSAAQGGNVRVESGATLKITGGLFEYGGINPETEEVVTTQGGNLVVLSENTTITGGTFVGGKALQYGGNIRAGKALTLGSGVIVKDGEAPKGGNLSNNSGGTLIIDGATITGGKAVAAEGITNAGGGGNIYVESGKALEIKSGTISDGAAVTYGGNIFVNHTDSVLTVSGGTISGGTAANGGSIAVVNGSFILSDGTISDGETTTSAGNVYVDGETSQFQMSGGTISGGSSKDGGNVRLRGGNHTLTGGTITGGASASAGANLFTGNSAELTIENVTITEGNAVGMGGGLYMGSGIVNINNCLIQGNHAKNGGSIAVYAGTLNFNGGRLEGGVSTEFGGNIYTDHGTLNIAGGEILNGSTDGYGGGIAMKNSKEGDRVLNITGGLISGNHAKAGAGGVYIHGYSGYKSDVVISGGTICENTSDKNGGGIALGTSFCSLTITGEAVIRDNTAKLSGGNINMNFGGTKIISGGTITGGSAANGDCINVVDKTLTISGTPVIDGIRLDNVTGARLVVTDAAWTTAIPVEVTGEGVFATADTDKTALFAPVDCEIVYENGELIAQLAKEIYVSATGDDSAAGTEAAPVQTLERALKLVADNGTIHLVGAVEAGTTWTAHGKTVTITGGEIILPETRITLNDNVTFRSLTMTMQMCETNTSSNYGSYYFYCNGFTTVIEEDVKVQYSFMGEITTDSYRSVTYTKDGKETTATASSTIYGGGNVDGITNTDLTILAGVWGNVYGGSNAKNIDGDVHLTVGGKINEGVDYVSHSHSSWHIICGGSRSGDISGTVYMNVIGGMNHTSTHGGSNGGTVGNIVLRVTGGRGMALYGGGRSGGTTVTGAINFYLEGGEWEQVFGGNLSIGLVGNVNIYVTGGKITRRLYGGCYSNCDEASGNWTADNFVTGDVNLYIGSDAEITCDLKDPDAGWESFITGGKYSDRGIYGHSRRAKPNADDAENARIIFLDQAAYNKHKGNLKAQDTVMQSIMRGVTAADYICYMGTNANGNVITVGATEVEDNANNALDLPAATATITVPESSYTYEGAALTPATVTYSDNWTYGELAITYANNDKAGTATAAITYEGITATTSFTIVETCKHENTTTTFTQIEGTETHTVTVTCQCGEQISQTTESCADENKDYVCDLCEGALAKPVAQVGQTQYMTLADAVANANGQTVVLLADCSDVTVAADVTIDLAGFNATGITVAEGAKLYLIDSATDDYEGAYGTAAVTGNVETFVTVDGKTYLVVADESGLYSAHCYAVAVTHISLDADKDALGYKAQFFGDAVAKSHVKAMGFNLWVTEDKVMTYQKDGKTALTLRLKNILASNGGDMTICGNAFVIFDVDTKTEISETCQTSMKEVLELVNGNFDSYNLSQQTAVKALVENFAEKLTGWALDKIQAWKAPEA